MQKPKGAISATHMGRTRGLDVAALPLVAPGTAGHQHRPGRPKPQVVVEAVHGVLPIGHNTTLPHLADLQAKRTAQAEEANRIDAVVGLINRLVNEHPASAIFEAQVCIESDLGIGIRVGQLAWTLDWHIPVRGRVD
jgi:hypothetical protein